MGLAVVVVFVELIMQGVLAMLAGAGAVAGACQVGLPSVVASKCLVETKA